MDFLFEFRVSRRGKATRVASSFGFELSHKLVRHQNDKLKGRREGVVLWRWRKHTHTHTGNGTRCQQAGRLSGGISASSGSARKKLINLPIVYKMCRFIGVHERERVIEGESSECVCLSLFTSDFQLPRKYVCPSLTLVLLIYVSIYTHSHTHPHTHTQLCLLVFSGIFFLFDFGKKSQRRKLFAISHSKQTLLIRNNAASSNACFRYSI